MKLEELLSNDIEDRYWNKIYHQRGKLMLYLSKSKESRVLWKIWKHDWKECLIVRRWEKHILHKINGRGFNYELLSRLPWETVVIVDREKSVMSYWLTVDDIIEQGKFLHFLTVWFEKQIFVPIQNFHVLFREKKSRWN